MVVTIYSKLVNNKHTIIIKQTQKNSIFSIRRFFIIIFWNSYITEKICIQTGACPRQMDFKRPDLHFMQSLVYFCIYPGCIPGICKWLCWSISDFCAVL